jgi:hypothetical protein
MKGIQNKKCIIRKIFVVHISGLSSEKKTLMKVFFMPGLRMHRHISSMLGITSEMIDRGGSIACPPRSQV